MHSSPVKNLLITGKSVLKLLQARLHQQCQPAEDAQLQGTVKEPNKFHNYETEKITRKASDMAEYIELFGSSARDRRARRI